MDINKISLNRILRRISVEFNLLHIKVSKLYRSLYSDQHQLTSTTSENRYPQLFEEARKALGGQADTQTRILSYGCSTGEECLTLKEYFPNSKIIGVDINKSNLRFAQSKIDDPDIQFLMSSEENIKAAGPYQAIFCLSVLCRWEDTKFLQNCEKIYPFSKYEATTSFLASQIQKDGLLIIYNSNFRFEDTRGFNEFDVVDTPTVSDSGFVVKFDSNNNRVSAPHRHCIYRKRY